MRAMTMRWGMVALLCLGGVAHADPPDDFGVACLDAKSGAVRWQSAVAKGWPPRLRVDGASLWLERAARWYRLELATGKRQGEGTPPAEHGTGTPQVRMGKVVSDKADKTITVRIDIAKRHRRYRKIVRSSSTLHAHDETNDANEGDLVRVVECRPLSRTKRWRLIEILERAK